MGEIYRSLYSVIPARVRDDHTLRPNAKLLYGELSALAQAEGYCWAWNARLAETLGISKRTVEDHDMPIDPMKEVTPDNREPWVRLTNGVAVCLRDGFVYRGGGRRCRHG